MLEKGQTMGQVSFGGTDADLRDGKGSSTSRVSLGVNYPRKGPCNMDCDCETLGLGRKDIEVVLLPSGHFRRIVKEPTSWLGGSESCVCHQAVENFFNECTLPVSSGFSLCGESANYVDEPQIVQPPAPAEPPKPAPTIQPEVLPPTHAEPVLAQPTEPAPAQAAEEAGGIAEGLSDTAVLQQLQGAPATKYFLQLDECGDIQLKNEKDICFIVAGPESKSLEWMLNEPGYRTDLLQPECVNPGREQEHLLYRLPIKKQLVYRLDEERTPLKIYVARKLDDVELDEQGRPYFLANCEYGHVRVDVPKDMKNACMVPWREYLLLNDEEKVVPGYLRLRLVFLPEHVGPAPTEDVERLGMEFEGEFRRQSSLLPLRAYIDVTQKPLQLPVKPVGGTSGPVKLRITTAVESSKQRPGPRPGVGSATEAAPAQTKPATESQMSARLTEKGDLVIKAVIRSGGAAAPDKAELNTAAPGEVVGAAA